MAPPSCSPEARRTKTRRTDITYIPRQKGLLQLVAVVDLFSRHVLSWRLSNSLDTEFDLDALEMALAGGRRPEIFLSDPPGFRKEVTPPIRTLGLEA